MKIVGVFLDNDGDKAIRNYFCRHWPEVTVTSADCDERDAAHDMFSLTEGLLVNDKYCFC